MCRDTPQVRPVGSGATSMSLKVPAQATAHPRLCANARVNGFDRLNLADSEVGSWLSTKLTDPRQCSVEAEVYAVNKVDGGSVPWAQRLFQIDF